LALFRGGNGKDRRTLLPANPHLAVDKLDHDFIVRCLNANNFSRLHDLVLRNGADTSQKRMKS